ncbi:gfo/Idh/MocA family oxidoreductase, partial [Chryseobacterium phosphatilyticum]
STHAELTVKAFEAGKHVFCEKPMANSPAECQRMIDAAKAAGRKLMIAYRAHWEPHNLRAKAMLDAGELGQVWFATSDHHRPLDPALPRDQWRMKRSVAGGGSLVDIGIYSLNGLQWFFGESPNAVAASMQAPPDDPRFAEVE